VGAAEARNGTREKLFHEQPHLLENNPILAAGTAGAGRFQILVEYASGVFVSTASSETIEDAVGFFLKQALGCEAGEIALFDRIERRVIGSAKWKVEPTENGLRVPRRHNLFCELKTALAALELQRRWERLSSVESVNFRATEDSAP
jgi:hypothetical protein